MKILSVNSGSSSFKFKLYQMPEEIILISGNFERIGYDSSFYTIKYNGEKIEKKAKLSNHIDAINIALDEILNNKIIDDINEIQAVSHRLVYGADKFKESVILTDEIVDMLDEYKDLAPLHMPANVECVKALMKILPNIKHVGCFDTAFHLTIDKERYIYPVPYEWYEKYNIRRYGFHRQSYRYIIPTVCHILNKNEANLIICHIGQGASISAIENNKCIDTSMGFTPNSGIVMGTRCGDIDYGIIKYLIKKQNMSFDEIDDMLNRHSGLLGMSNLSNDWRDIDDAITKGNRQAYLTHKIFVDSIVTYISKYYVELKGQVDALVFTAGVGENASHIRRMVIDRLNCLGFYCDNELNDITRLGKEGIISSKDSKVPIYVISTNEELVMAKDAYELVK